jgi:hypothetical protein
MEMLSIVVGTAILLSVAYRFYGPILVRLFQLDDRRPTPAISMRDDLDYVPCTTPSLLNQHFSAIAAAGPIVGPILAGLAWGWGPALLWIVLGSIFIGGVHDFSALVASIRHRATSITMVVKAHVSHRAYLLFQTFVYLALMYIVVAFMDITATMFVGAMDLKSGTNYVSVSEAMSQEGAGSANDFSGWKCGDIFAVVFGAAVHHGTIPAKRGVANVVSAGNFRTSGNPCDSCRSVDAIERGRVDPELVSEPDSSGISVCCRSLLGCLFAALLCRGFRTAHMAAAAAPRDSGWWFHVCGTGIMWFRSDHRSHHWR